LFRWRSYLPLAFLPLFVLALRQWAHTPVDERLGPVWDFTCILVSFSGLVVRALVVGQTPPRTSGRNTIEQVADVLNTTGLYSVVRHPLYLGNFLSWLGVAMFPQSALTVLLAVMAFSLYYERIMFAEEAFLRGKFRFDFEDWAARTPAFFPRLRQWRMSTHAFSWKMVLRGEYSGMFAIVATFTGLEVIRLGMVGGDLGSEILWLVFFAAGLGAYLALRWAKRSGRLPLAR
jgi:protein-S-isoprenylcysteine O-methyltransferase Ste14